MVGALLVDDLMAGVRLAGCELLALQDVLWEAVIVALLSPTAALVLVVSVLNDRCARGDLAVSSASKAAEIQARFVLFLERGHGINDLGDIACDDVRRFVNAKSKDRTGVLRSPSARTMDNRLWAVRSYFAVLRQLGIGVGDPVAGMSVRRGDVPRARPLTDVEQRRGRSASTRFAGDTRGPAAWALACATATTAELSAANAASVDWTQRRVWLDGGKRRPRWGHLDEWGAQQLRTRLADLDVRDDSELPLLYDGSRGGTSRQSTGSQLLASILRRAGLALDPLVKPSSVVGWAASGIYAESGQDLVATSERIGVASLDATARILGIVS